MKYIGDYIFEYKMKSITYLTLPLTMNLFLRYHGKVSNY